SPGRWDRLGWREYLEHFNPDANAAGELLNLGWDMGAYQQCTGARPVRILRLPQFHIEQHLPHGGRASPPLALDNQRIRPPLRQRVYAPLGVQDGHLPGVLRPALPGIVARPHAHIGEHALPLALVQLQPAPEQQRLIRHQAGHYARLRRYQQRLPAHFPIFSTTSTIARIAIAATCTSSCRICAGSRASFCCLTHSKYSTSSSHMTECASCRLTIGGCFAIARPSSSSTSRSTAAGACCGITYDHIPAAHIASSFNSPLIP